MRRLMLLLFILLAIAILANSQAPVHVSGADGQALLKDLTESSPGSIGFNSTANNTTNNSTSITASNATNKVNDLWSWGGKPHDYTNPSEGDYLNDTGI